MSILYENFIDDWERKKSNEELDIMNNSGQDGKKISLLCIFLGQITPVARLIQIIFENLNNWNNHDDDFKNYTLYIDAYFPFEWNYSPVFELTCSMEYIGTLMAALAYSGTDGLFSEIAFHLTGQYHILRLKLLNIVNKMNENTLFIDIDDGFSYIVNNHERINRFIPDFVFNSYFIFHCLLIFIFFY